MTQSSSVFLSRCSFFITGIFAFVFKMWLVIREGDLNFSLPIITLFPVLLLPWRLSNSCLCSKIWHNESVFPYFSLFHTLGSPTHLLFAIFVNHDWSILSKTCISEYHENNSWVVTWEIKFRDLTTRPTHLTPQPPPIYTHIINAEW